MSHPAARWRVSGRPPCRTQAHRPCMHWAPQVSLAPAPSGNCPCAWRLLSLRDIEWPLSAKSELPCQLPAHRAVTIHRGGPPTTRLVAAGHCQGILDGRPSTISREIRRNACHTKRRPTPSKAQERANGGRRRCHSAIMTSPSMRQSKARFTTTSLTAALSSASLAYIRFSLAFSASSSLTRLVSDISMLLYLLFHW